MTAPHAAPPAPGPRPATPPVRWGASLLLVLALIALAGGTAALERLRALSGHPEVCAFKARHGVECLGCGGTRAFGAVAGGQLAAGFRLNPIGAMTGLLSWAVVPATVAAWLTRRWRPVVVVLLAAVPALAFTLLLHAATWWRSLPTTLELW